MKHNWEYKKLGDVASFQRGLTYSSEDEVDFSTKCVLRSNNINLENSCLDLSELKYLREDFIIPNDRMFCDNSIFICMSNGSKQHIGKVAYIKEKINYAFGGFMGLIVPGKSFQSKFVFYNLRSFHFKSFLNSVGEGANIKNLKFSDLSKYPIPVPPLPTQQSIVSELDTLSGIIAKCKETLKDYDALEQSIFYDMFGDPVKNEMGWEVKKLGECFKVTSSKRIYMEELTDCGIPFLKVADINNLINENCTPTSFISNDKYQELKSNGHVPSPNDLLVTARGTIGKVYIIQENDAFYFQDGMITWLKQGRYKIEPKYIKNMFQVPNFLEYLGQISNNSTVAFLSIAKLATVKIPLPPLPLQQTFASKIEAIERMKAETKEALKEAETLFEARMDYWFG